MKKERILTGVLIDTETRKAGVATIIDTLENLYHLLHCDTITTTYRVIGSKEYCIIADDEGLLRKTPIVSAWSVEDGGPALVGSLFIVSARTDRGGNFLSISSEDIEEIEKNVKTYTLPNEEPKRLRPLLCVRC